MSSEEVALRAPSMTTITNVVEGTHLRKLADPTAIAHSRALFKQHRPVASSSLGLGRESDHSHSLRTEIETISSLHYYGHHSFSAQVATSLPDGSLEADCTTAAAAAGSVVVVVVVVAAEAVARNLSRT